MIIALTGTPGTGKTSASKILLQNNLEIVNLNEIACEKQFVDERDEERDSAVVDLSRLDEYVKKSYSGKELVILQSHLSHLLKSVDKIIVLRCHPNELRKRLLSKKWNDKKIKENLDAETLDIILCEAIDLHPNENIFEIDTTNLTISDVASSIIEIIRNKFKNIKKYEIGNIDWSEEVLKDF